jgi:hypothetical protein
MEAEPENRPSAGAAADTAAASAFLSPDDLVRFASSYFASDFPNPGRLDCPPSDTLSASVLSGKLPDEKLRAHLFGCSECFKEYQRALAAQRSADFTSTVSWLSRLKLTLVRRPLPAFAGVFSLLFLSFVGVYVWQQYKTAPRPVAASRDVVSANTSQDSSSNSISTQAMPETATDIEAREKRAARSEPATPTNRRPTVARRSGSAGQVHRDLVAMNTVKVDLEDYTSLRGGAGGGNDAAKAIRISRPRTRLLLTLPEGGIEGLYRISIVDNSGKALVTANTRSANGKTIITMLDLRRLPTQKYRLRIYVEGEPPSYYPIIVEDQPLSRVKRK